MADMNQKQIVQLQVFIELCKSNPSVLHLPELAFFRNYLESMGAVIPETSTPRQETFEMPKPNVSSEPKVKAQSSKVEPESESSESSEESEIELDSENVIEPDTDEPQPMGDESVEVTEEMMDESSDKRCQAQEALSNGNFDEANKLFTEAIQKNPQSAALYAKRAGVFIKLQKPVAAIRDCNKALELNPDQAVAFKFRGRANSLLGNWEDAALDLANSQKIDYSDDANEWLKEVMPNAKKIQEHRRKYERKREQKMLKENVERLRKAKEAREKASKEQEAYRQANENEEFGTPDPTEMKAKFEAFLKSPDVAAACQDPEVASALQEIMTNPNNIMKHMGNEKVMGLLSKMM